MTESGFIAVPGGSLYYEADGSGPTVVLIHAGVANLRMWDPLVPALSDRYRVIRYDTRGYGQTEAEHTEFSNRDDVVAVLDHLGVERATLVGTSRGGIIAIDTVIEHPALFEGLGVVAGGVGGLDLPAPEGDPESIAALQKMWEDAEKATEAKDWESVAAFETRWWVDGPGQPTDRVDPVLREKVHHWILSTYQAEKEEGIPRRLDPPAAGRLGEIDIPVLVIYGNLDEVETGIASKYLADNVAGAELIEYEGAAHMLTLEQPDRFAADLRAFLDRVNA
jgi:pimeloyl-ACP methyl ester carboxylesterase